MKYCYTAILENQQILFLHRQQVGQWRVLEIEGESVNRCESADNLGKLLEQVECKLNHSNQLAEAEFHFLYGENQLPLLYEVSNQLTKLGCVQWQILQWQPLFKRACASQVPKQSPWQDHKWLETIAMPMFEHSLNYQDKAWEAERQKAKKEHAENMETLKAERTALEVEVSALRGQIQAMQRPPSVEQLAIFLPIIYRNFWHHIKPSDLALLAETFDVPAVPSPFTDPDEFVVVKMKKRLLALPTEERQRLLDFCQQLGLQKYIRPTMRDLFTDYPY